MDNLEKKACSSRSRCRNFRECEDCALIRQRNIADQTAKLEKQGGQLTLTVVKPNENTQAAIKALHGKFMRRCMAAQDAELAGLYTIERGEQFGRLHVNYLTTKGLPSKWKGCESWSELVSITARDAAAYISKRSGMPEPMQYQGRLYGTFGKVGEILATSRHVAPVVQAAAVEIALSGGDMGTSNGIVYRTDEEERKGWVEGAMVDGKRVWWTRDKSEWTWKHPKPSREECREIARARLPNLYAVLGKNVKI